MSNFIGFTLECVQRALAEDHYILPELWLVGHPGKLAKVLDDVWDTHSSNSRSAVEAVLRVADEFGLDDRLRDSIASSRTVEGIIELLRLEVSSRAFWRLVERKIEAKVGTQLNNVDRICVRLFQMDGKALGGGE
jgi:cobalt-precorrin-5B (C1)-methyltransferase